MAATTSGALKAYIEGLGLGLSVYRDAAPSKLVDGVRVPAVPLPYVTVRESIAASQDRDGDLGDLSSSGTTREDVQVDLWQTWRDSAGRPEEDYGLAEELAKLLRGARLVPIGSRAVYGITRVFAVRLLEEESNVVHHAITATVHRAS